MATSGNSRLRRIDSLVSVLLVAFFIGGLVIWNEHDLGKLPQLDKLFMMVGVLPKFSSSNHTLSSIKPIATPFPLTVDSIFSLVNQEREKAGLDKLLLNDKLSSAALKKAEYMCEKQYWAHIAPDGTTPWSFIINVGYSYAKSGENLARDFNDADSAVRSWMNSETHRENILMKNYSETGIALKKCTLQSIYTTIVVQMFAQPMTGRVGYEQVGNSGSSSNVNPNTPVHCPINELCGGGTTPLTYAECQNSTCCKLDNGWVFYNDKAQCAAKQKQLGLVSLEGNGVEVDGYTDPNKPVHCSISPKCGGGTTPLTYAECQNSICCHMADDTYVFMKDRSQCR